MAGEIAARERERSTLLDFKEGRASKSETMRALGITTVYELRMKMAEHGVAARHLPQAQVDRMVSSVDSLFPK